MEGWCYRFVVVVPVLLDMGEVYADTLLPFDASTAASVEALRGALGAGTPEEAQSLIKWARGQDVDDEDGDGDRSEAREWLLGDVLHSTPAVLNYGALNGFSKNNPNVRIFFGSGAGVLSR